MAKAALKCLKEFAAWGHTYAPGATIPEPHHSKWPEGTLANRLGYGDVEWNEDEPEGAPTKGK